MAKDRARREAMEEAALALRRVMVAMRTRFQAALRDAGLSFPQWVILKRLHKAGALTLRDVADALECTPANATGIVDRMERDGLVTRTRSETDRRVVHVALTPRGKERVRELAHLAPRALDDLFEGWSAEDFAALRHALGKLKLTPEDRQEL